MTIVNADDACATVCLCCCEAFGNLCRCCFANVVCCVVIQQSHHVTSLCVFIVVANQTSAICHGIHERITLGKEIWHRLLDPTFMLFAVSADYPVTTISIHADAVGCVDCCAKVAEIVFAVFVTSHHVTSIIVRKFRFPKRVATQHARPCSTVQACQSKYVGGSSHAA